MGNTNEGREWGSEKEGLGWGGFDTQTMHP